MSDEKKAKKKGGKGKLIAMILGGVTLLGGGGAAVGFYAAGTFSADAVPKEDPNKPVLVLRGENPEEVAKAHMANAAEHEPGKGHGPAKPVDLPTPKDSNAYQATYFQIGTPFTSNMSDTDSFAQISIAASTYYDQRVIDAMKTHELAIRSKILMMLADQQEIELATPKGKEVLQGKLKTIINDVLKEKTGYSGVDNVYFTNFVIQ